MRDDKWFRPLAPRVDETGKYRSPNVCFAGVGAYLAANVLNVSQKAIASFVAPATVGLGLSLGAPTSVSMSEVGTGSGYTPQSVSMNSVAASGTLSSNAVAVSFGPFSSNQSISGIFMKDTLATAGNMLWFGPLATVRSVIPGDTLVVAIGAFTTSLT